MGFDLWEVIAKWTQETFHFGYVSDAPSTDEPRKEDSQTYSGLQEALDDCDITVPLIPTWLPDGYEEVDVRIDETPSQRRFAAKYQADGTSFRIRIAEYLSSAPAQVEQSDLLVEVYTVNDIAYYIFDNNGQLQVMWVVDCYECCISGPLSLSEIKAIIDSIGKG